ncbi:MAG: aminoacyl-tRNA hydrolase [Alphaproteobacteria bacterium]|nr:aminoacyl-tRNA hydrolase [Alphaproteobacteria bacterium]
MLLLAGLGNPGPEHANNRHNIGFMAVDKIAERHNFPPFEKKFRGLFTKGTLDREGTLGKEETLLLKPTTYMNESGKSLAELIRFYKLPLSQLVVFYDELDLPPGTLRMKLGGGLAGHNGLRSLKAHIGNEFRRARLGIGHPGDKDKVTSYVLHDFSNAERTWLTPLLDALAEHAPLLATHNDTSTNTGTGTGTNTGTDATYQNRVRESLAHA